MAELREFTALGAMRCDAQHKIVPSGPSGASATARVRLCGCHGVARLLAYSRHLSAVDFLGCAAMLYPPLQRDDLERRITASGAPLFFDCVRSQKPRGPTGALLDAAPEFSRGCAI
jgi:hypothetical protein